MCTSMTELSATFTMFTRRRCVLQQPAQVPHNHAMYVLLLQGHTGELVYEQFREVFEEANSGEYCCRCMFWWRREYQGRGLQAAKPCLIMSCACCLMHLMLIKAAPCPLRKWRLA